MAACKIPVSKDTRAPLDDATDRVNNASPRNFHKRGRPQGPDPNPLRAHPTNSRAQKAITGPGSSSHPPSSAAVPGNRRAAAISQEAREREKRDSQLSSSTASSGKRKTHIGPWQLGRTLGKGSAARVRLARHHLTQELAAVKILSKNACHMTQAGSLAELDKWDRTREEFTTEKHMPLSIEREVAILKLIDHPNIMKLYDIWENRSEM
jgi:serine/threonine-protein kinase HSL1, negative regulator of Swe1 kinase